MMKISFRRHLLCAALGFAALLPSASSAQEASEVPVATPTSAATLSDLMSGRDIPLTLRLGDLNASWRQFSVGGGLDLTIFAPNVETLGAANPTAFFTRGQTAVVGSESFLVAYRVLASLPLLKLRDEALSKRAPSDEVVPLKLPPDTVLSLSLLNVRQLFSMNDIRPFNAALIATAQSDRDAQVQKDAATSVNNLKQIGGALLQYTQDYDGYLPPMQSVSSLRQVEVELQTRTTTHVQVVLQPYAKNTTIFAHPRTKELYRPNPILSRKYKEHIINPASFVAFYEASPAPDGKRAVLYVDGHVQRIAESQWPALKQASKIGTPVPKVPENPPQATGNSTAAVELSGAAALLYVYKQHRNLLAHGPQGAIYQSANGRLYFRDAKTGQAKYVAPPKEPIIISEDEAAPYRDYQGFNGSEAGIMFGGYGAGVTFKDAVPAQPLEGY